MKKNSVISYIRDNYKVFIPIALMIVLFAAFLFYYKFSRVNVRYDESTGNFYQYFYDKKYEYEGVVSKNKKGVIVDFKEKNININQDSTPIYYKKGDKVIFPSDMSVVMPILNCSEYLSRGYSYIVHKDNRYKLITDRYNDNLGHYFLYDGEDLYFFIEKVTLKINNEEIVLSPLSYVVSRYGNFVSYYDMESDTYRSINYSGDNALISNDYYNINISKDAIDYYGTDVILTSSIGVLNTIDKKG